MKVTALINDDLINSVINFSKSKNITEGLVIALEDYVYRKKIDQFINEIQIEPVQFEDGFSALDVRNLNRKDKK